MKLLNGKKTADAILKNIAREIKAKKTKPGLAVLLIGKDRASEIYVRIKKKRAEEIGMDFSLFRFNRNNSDKEVVKKIKNLNDDKKINGIIVQLPLPKKFNTQKIINSINPEKDVDGFLNKCEELMPVFPQAIIKLIESSKKKLGGRKAIVISNSKLFGEMMLEALRRKKIKSEYVLRKEISKNIAKIKKADILVSAVGVRGIIKNEMMKEGMIVIDGGIIKIGKKVFGDVDFESTKKLRGFITPVPGGVGPVTVACLLENVYLASKIKQKPSLK
jgi:methylenetetrahydrofolate dehydrogenase (NADP+)/methenyltetrahydrofolate cyclohydrolase